MSPFANLIFRSVRRRWGEGYAEVCAKELGKWNMEQRRRIAEDPSYGLTDEERFELAVILAQKKRRRKK